MRLVSSQGGELREFLLDQIDRSHTVRICTAYATLSGVEVIASALDRCRRRGGIVRVLVGDDLLVTEAEALYRLLGLTPLVKVCSLSAGSFHPKIYIFQSAEQVEVLLGSANLTRRSYYDNLELCLHFSGAPSDPLIASAFEFFKAAWESPGAADVTRDFVGDWVAAQAAVREQQNALLDQAGRARQTLLSSPRRKIRSRPSLLEMCQKVVQVGERLRYRELVQRIVATFPEWEHGLQPEATLTPELARLIAGPEGKGFFAEEGPGGVVVRRR